MIDTYILGGLLFGECPTERKLIPGSMFEYLEANYNSVKMICAKLTEDEFLSREGFGSFNQHYSGFFTQLNDKIEVLVEGE